MVSGCPDTFTFTIMSNSLGAARPGQFCTTKALSPAIQTDRPPVLGYNYSNKTLAARVDETGQTAFPSATKVMQYQFDNYVSVAGMWLSTSIINPNAGTIGVYVAKDDRDVIAIPLNATIYFHHVSISTLTSTRSSGMSFGETAGLLVNPNESISVYVSGNDADMDVFFSLTIYWIVR